MYYQLRNLLTVFLVACDVLEISRSFSVVYVRWRYFIHFERECNSEIQRLSSKSRVELKLVLKKALFCGDCCDRNQAIILVASF